MQRMSQAGPVSVLRSLPVGRWARHLLHGTVRLAGEAPEATRVGADRPVDLPAGSIVVDLTFEGGEEPSITSLTLTAADRELPAPASPAAFVAALLDVLHDLAIDLEVHTDGEVVIDLGSGLQATLADGGSIALRAAAHGSPEAPRLVEPLEVDVADHGIKVTHARAPGLSRMARVRVHRFALHPDGTVHLDGGGTGVLDFAVSSGLRRASSRLASLIRESPRFERLRAFLLLTE